MLYRYCWICLVISLATAISCQAQYYYRPWQLRADLSMPFRQGFGGALEWQYKHQGALSVQVSWEQHAKATEKGLFNGNLVANFAELKTDTLARVNGVKEHFVGTYYVGDGRRLPVQPEHVAIASLSIRFGNKFIFTKPNGKWHWSLQPALSFVRHYYFEIHQQYQLLDEVQTFWQYGTYPYELKVGNTYSRFQETQMMRAFYSWIPGLAYEIGVGRQLGRHCTIEARFSGLYNPEPLYKAPQPAPARLTQGRWLVLVGYAFGKMRCDD